MAYGKPEKICRHEKSRAYRKWLKRVMAKARRLQWRRLGENANVKDVHYGWSE